MKPLIWKEWRENLKWVGLPTILTVVPLVLLGGPDEPMWGTGGGVLLFLITAVFGAGLGFLQIFFESRGDHRALLLHRPLSRSHIFLAKAVAGVGLYLLAVGVPFVGVQLWMATPGHMPAPYDRGTALPWLADILAGLVYYFAGMLTAQREARWYGSRGLGLAAAFASTIFVWCLPEFWQAMLAIVVIGTVVGVAAWGSFVAGGAYAPQPPLARAALALTLLTGLLVVSFVGKLVVGQGLGSEVTIGYTLDRQGRVLVVPWKAGVGPTGAVTDLDGRVPPDLEGRRVDRNLIEEIEAPSTNLEWPQHRSYRNSGRFYMRYYNESTPSNEAWFYAPTEGRLLGYDTHYHQFLGSFGPDGFVPAGGPPGERFQGRARCPTRLWDAFAPSYLVFPGGVYDVDFARRTIRKLFTPADGDTVLEARRWKDRREKDSLVVVGTVRSVHVLTLAGAPVVSAPRLYDRDAYGFGGVGRLEDPQRYFVWYGRNRWAEPEEVRSLPSYVLEYDAAGHEITRRSLPPRLPGGQSPAVTWFGLATPVTEVAALVGTTRQLRRDSRLTHGMDVWVLCEVLEEWIAQFVPLAVYSADTNSGQFLGFTALTLLSAAASAVGCFLLARRYAFSRRRQVCWALCGFAFGWAGLVLMVALQDWPARIRCPGCGRPRRVDRDRCEHCGAAHAVPPPDETEVFETTAARIPVECA